MVMALIFIFIDLFVIAIFYAVYGGNKKYKEGMLLGVHIPSYGVRDPEVEALMKAHRKRTKRFYLWNFLASTAICLLALWHFSIFMVFWCIWLIELTCGAFAVLFRSHRQLYDLKMQRGWQGASGGRIVVVDTRDSASDGRPSLPVWWHLPGAVAGTALSILASVWGLVQEETALWIFIVIFASMEVIFILLHIGTNRVRSEAYSSDTKINMQVNQLEKRIYSVIWLASSYINVVSLAVILYSAYREKWIFGWGLIGYIVLQTLVGLFILSGIFYLGYKKKEILDQDTKPLYVDDDIYWKNGWYSNPNDKRMWVQDRFCDANYTTNMASKGGKIITFGTIAVVAVILIGVCVGLLKEEFTPIELDISQKQVAIVSPSYGMEFKAEEIRKVELLNDLPDESYSKTSGYADGNRMLGRFRGRESGPCRMYIYKGDTPVLRIELTDTLIYINSRDFSDVKMWYRELNTLLQK